MIDIKKTIVSRLKKLPIGLAIFLTFAVTGIGVAEVFHNKQLTEKSQSSQLESEDIKGVENASVIDSSLKTSQTVSEKAVTTKLSGSKSDDDSGEEVKQSSRHGGDDESNDEDENEDDSDDDSRSSKSSQVTPPSLPTSSTVSTPTPTPSAPKFTMAQVATHNSSASCYSVVNGGVYDLTAWIGQHPGGGSAIKSMCGLDASDAFNGQHGGQARPTSELAGFKIGMLVQ